MEVLLILLAGVLLVGGIFVYYYNRMLALSMKVDETHSNIDVLLKQRFDTLTSLLGAVKGYMGHEQETLVRVTELRNMLSAPGLPEGEKRALHNELSVELPKFMAVAEAYPDLKANDSFVHLQKSIMNLEENLSAGRRTFNAMVNQYNVTIQSFPALLFASMFGHQKKELFEAPEAERQNVEISF